MMFLSAHNFRGKLTSGHMWPVLYPLKNNMEIICLSMWDNKKMHRFWIPFCVRRIVRCCYNLKRHSTTYQTQKKLRTFNGQSMGVGYSTSAVHFLLVEPLVFDKSLRLYIWMTNSVTEVSHDLLLSRSYKELAKNSWSISLTSLQRVLGNSTVSEKHCYWLFQKARKP